MRTRARLAAALVLASLAWPTQPGGAQSAAPSSDQVVATRIDEYLQAEAKVNGFAGTALLARKGTPIVSKGYGMANAEWSIPNTPATKFRLGSITKQFTSMAILQLEQQGKLKVQDSVCAHVDPCPDTWKPVTIHHLLTHTSGIPSYTNNPSYLATMMVPKTVEQMVAGFRDLPLEFEPGAQFKYNNSGYFLLGVVIERLTKRSYGDVLQDQIFGPLGMNESGYDDPKRIIPLRASGYSRQGEAITNAAYLDMVQPFAAGALYSTVDDLLKWDRALYTDRLLPSAARTAMFTPFKNNYAYGWGVVEPSPQTSGKRQYSHGGGINGFATMIVRVPDDEVTAIVLSNVQQAPAGRLANTMLAILDGRPYQVPAVRTVAKVDSALFDSYVGQYELAPTFVMTVTREGDQLFVQATGQGKIPFYPESNSKFFAKVVDAQVSFGSGPDGAITHLVLHQNGKDQKAAKKK